MDKPDADGKRPSFRDFLRQTESEFVVNPQSGLFEPADDKRRAQKIELHAKVDSPSANAERPRGSFQDIVANAISFGSLIFSVLTLAGLVAGAYIAMGQWDEMRKATKASADAANTAASALDENKKQFELVQRPWIGIDGVSFNNFSVGVPETNVPHIMRNPVALKMNISYTVKNTGTSPALDVIPTFAFSILDADSLPRSIFPKCTVPENRHRPVFFLMPGGTANHEEDVDVTAEHDGQKKIDVVWLQVCISYRDQLGKSYSTKLTYVSSSDPDSTYETVPRTEFRYRRLKGWFLFKGEAK